jgi:ryanodine receptor 2
MGSPVIKYGDTLVYIQHVKSGCWLSYQTYETKKRGVGKVEEKKAVLLAEGHMDDCFTIVRAQEEESRSGLVIRKCLSLFTKFNRAMDSAVVLASTEKQSRYLHKISLDQILRCLDDLIQFFAQPNDDCPHEERQTKLKALRNRQDLFHEEGRLTGKVRIRQKNSRLPICKFPRNDKLSARFDRQVQRNQEPIE